MSAVSNEPAAVPPGPEPVDAAAFAALRELVTDDAPDFLYEVVDLFLADLTPKIARLGTAIPAADAGTIASAAHSLKGSSSNIGAAPLAALCATLERSARQGELSDAPALLGRIAVEADRVRQWIEREVPRS